MIRRLCTGCVLFFALASPSRAADTLDRAALDRIGKEAVDSWAVPGLAVAIVRGDEVYLQGHGVRALGAKAPVTPDTIFAYASLTKAFAAASVGLLVDDGKAHWDDRVRQHLETFRLADPLADRDVTLRDLMCHRTGLSRNDLLWYRANWPLEECVRRLEFLQPTASFRSRYQYANLPYIACGMAISRAAGQPWQEFLRQRLLDPLGMKNVVFTGAAARERKDHATPHRREGGKWTPGEWYPDEKQIRASGSLKGGVRDLSAWMRFQLNRGTFEGRRLLSAESLLETHRPHIVVPLSSVAATMTGTTQESYGLGWHILDYRGHRVDLHGGSNDGFRGRLLLVPGARIGVALLTNCEEDRMLHALGWRFLDQLLGLEPKDWFAFYRKRPSTAEAKPVLPARRPGSKPTRELDAYAGVYMDSAYGKVEVKREGDRLELTWSSFQTTLEHFHFDTFVTRTRTLSDRKMEGQVALFSLDADAKVKSVSLLGRKFERSTRP